MSKYFSFLRKKRPSLHEEDEVGVSKGKRHQKKSRGSSSSPSPSKKGIEGDSRFSVHNLDVFDDLKEDVFLSDNDSVLDNVSFGEIALEAEADRKGGGETQEPLTSPSPSGSGPKTIGDPRSESVSHRSEDAVIEEDEGHVMDTNDEAHDEDIDDFMDEAFNDLEDEEEGVHDGNEEGGSVSEEREILSDHHFVTIVPVSFGAEAYRQIKEESSVASNEISYDVHRAKEVGSDDRENDNANDYFPSDALKERLGGAHEPNGNGDIMSDVDAAASEEHAALPVPCIVKETCNIPNNFTLDIEDNGACIDNMYTEREDGIFDATEVATSTPVLNASCLDDWGKLNEIPKDSSFSGEATCGQSSFDSTPLAITGEISTNEGRTELDTHFINGEFTGKEMPPGNELFKASIPGGNEIDVSSLSSPDDPSPQAIPSEVVEHASAILSVSTPEHVNGETEQPSNLTTEEHKINFSVPTRQNSQTRTVFSDRELSPLITQDFPPNGGTLSGSEDKINESIANYEYQDTDAKLECSSLGTEIEIQQRAVAGDGVCVSRSTGDALLEENSIGAEPDGISRTLSKELHCEEVGGLFSDNDTMDELLTKSESSSIPFLSCERPSFCPSDFEEDIFDSAKEDLSDDETPDPGRTASSDSSPEERGEDSLQVARFSREDDEHGEKTFCDHRDSGMQLSGTSRDVEGGTKLPDRAFERNVKQYKEAASGKSPYEGTRTIDSASRREDEGSPEINACLVTESDSSIQEVDKDANNGNPTSLVTDPPPPMACEDTTLSSSIPGNNRSIPVTNDQIAKEKDYEPSPCLQEKDKCEISPEYTHPITSHNSSESSQMGNSGTCNRGLTTICESPCASVICDQKLCPVLDLATKLTEAASDQSDMVLARRAYCTSEENFLINIVNSERLRAEARLAQRRAARAEARELRLRELERQQQEQDNNDEEEQCSGTPNAPTATHTPAVPAVNSTFSPSEMAHPRAGRSRSSVAASSVSRRSSEDSTADDSLPTSARELKADLKELDEKFRKAMITNAQLDNEKATLTFEVEFLKDKYSELEESHTQLTKDHRKKCSENEQLRKLSNKLKEEVQMVRRVLQERDELIQEYGLVLICEEDGEDSYDDMDDPERRDDTVNALSPRRIAVKKALLSHEASELLAKGAASGSLDVRLRKYAEDKNDLEDEVRRLKMELEEELSRRRKENGLDHEKQKEASKSLNEYKFRVQKAEAEVSTLQANVARLESLVSRYKASTEQLEQSEEELKSEKRRLQRELRDAQNRLEELELTNSHIQKRLDKLKTARSTLLKDLSQEPA